MSLAFPPVHGPASGLVHTAPGSPSGSRPWEMEQAVQDFGHVGGTSE